MTHFSKQSVASIPIFDGADTMYFVGMQLENDKRALGLKLSALEQDIVSLREEVLKVERAKLNAETEKTSELKKLVTRSK